MSELCLSCRAWSDALLCKSCSNRVVTCQWRYARLIKRLRVCKTMRCMSERSWRRSIRYSPQRRSPVDALSRWYLGQQKKEGGVACETARDELR